MNDIYDVVIIGGGPAGLSAGLYTSRSKLKTLIIEKVSFGGQAISSNIIDNYPGCIENESGSTLINRMINQVDKFKVHKVKDEVLSLQLENKLKIIKCKNNTYSSKVVILAMGCENKKLLIDNEEKLSGRGISYCALCDGHIFEDLDVYVVGSGDSAVQGSIYLSKFTEKVTILNKNESLKCNKSLEEKCKKIKNISILHNVIIEQIIGEEVLNKIKIKNTNTNEETIFTSNCDEDLLGLFILIGLTPRTSLVKDILDLDDEGYIKANQDMRTNIDGVYAVGDCISKRFRQIVTAVSDGAIAAMDCEKYIENQWGENFDD